MRAGKNPCPDCGAKLKRVSQKWRCTRCWARGVFLNEKPLVVSRYLTFSTARGWRLNPHNPLASLVARAKAVGR